MYWLLKCLWSIMNGFTERELIVQDTAHEYWRRDYKVGCFVHERICLTRASSALWQKKHYTSRKEYIQSNIQDTWYRRSQWLHTNMNYNNYKGRNFQWVLLNPHSIIVWWQALILTVCPILVLQGFGYILPPSPPFQWWLFSGTQPFNPSTFNKPCEISMPSQGSLPCHLQSPIQWHQL